MAIMKDRENMERSGLKTVFANQETSCTNPIPWISGVLCRQQVVRCQTEHAYMTQDCLKQFQARVFKLLEMAFRRSSWGAQRQYQIWRRTKKEASAMARLIELSENKKTRKINPENLGKSSWRWLMRSPLS
jgi:predicted glycosyl hydrolase (DUF1957 family)